MVHLFSRRRTRDPVPATVALPGDGAAFAPLRHRSSAAPLAMLYAALIVYASLSPFSGWRLPIGVPWWGFAHVPWPRYWTGFDVVSNLLGYIPLGTLVFVALLRSGWRSVSSAACSALAGTALSLAMESLQNYLPQRVPSGMDWALNAGGTVIGVLLAWAVHGLGGVQRWQILRDRWFIARSAGGLALLLLWPIGLLFPAPVPMGLGQVLDRLQALIAEELQGTPWADWVVDWHDSVPLMVPLSRGTEMIAVMLGLLAPCLVAFAVA